MIRNLAANLIILSASLIFLPTPLPAQSPDDNLINLLDVLTNQDRGKIERMVRSGFPLDFQHPLLGKSTPLHLASELSSPDIALFLLEEGADMYALNDDNATPFMVGIFSGNYALTDSMLHIYGYDIDTKVGPLLGDAFESMGTPLTYAVFNQDEPIIQYLVKNGADKSLTAEFLLHAVDADQYEIVEHFAATSFGLNQSVAKYNDSTALNIANEQNNVPMVRFLLDNGADILARNASGMTVFGIAVTLGFFDLAELYLNEYSYDVNQLDDWHRSPLFYVTVELEDTAAIRFLFENGADPNILQYDGSTFPHVYMGDRVRNDAPVKKEIIELYLDNGFDPNRLDLQDYNFLHSLAMHPEPDLLDLVDGMELNLDQPELAFGFTPLTAAIHMGNLATARRLLEMGADPNIPYGEKDQDRRTALSYAVEAGMEDTVRLLVEFGVDLKPAVDYASDDFRRKIADLF